MHTHSAALFQSRAPPYGLMAAVYCLKLHQISLASRQPVHVDVHVHKFDIKCVVSMCLSDK